MKFHQAVHDTLEHQAMLWRESNADIAASFDAADKALKEKEAEGDDDEEEADNL